MANINHTLGVNHRSISHTLIDNEEIETAYTSDSIYTRDFRNFVLYLNIDSTGSATDILFDIEFSDDDVTFYKLTDWWYGDLRYTDTQTADGVLESMGYYIQGRYVRLTATVTGGSQGNTFTVTAKMEFYN